MCYGDISRIKCPKITQNILKTEYKHNKPDNCSNESHIKEIGGNVLKIANSSVHANGGLFEHLN